MSMDINIAFNWYHKGKHPSHLTGKEKQAWFRDYNGRFKNVSITQERIIAGITSGYGFTSWHTRYRHSGNFICGQHVAVDIDHGATPDDILSDEVFREHGSFLYTTPSHTDEAPRFRPVFLLAEPVYDRDLYAHMTVGATLRYRKQADASCKDPARLFYGSENATVITTTNEPMSIDDAKLLFADLSIRARREEEESIRKLMSSGKVYENSIPDALASHILGRESRRIIDALDGEKHRTLYNVSYTLAGYAAAGYITLQQVESAIGGALYQRRADIKDMVAAEQTMRDAIELGITRPLFIQINDPVEIGSDESEIVSMTAREFSKRLDDAYMKGFRDGMTAQRKFSAGLSGIDDSVLGMLGIGYRYEVDDDTGEIIHDAATFPFVWNDDVINVEFRPAVGKPYYYSQTGPISHTIEDGEQPIYATDYIEALWMWLNFGGDGRYGFHVLANPSDDGTRLKLRDNATIVGSPVSYVVGENIGIVVPPMSIREMVHHGMKQTRFDHLLSQRMLL